MGMKTIIKTKIITMSMKATTNHNKTCLTKHNPHKTKKFEDELRMRVIFIT